jgi:hypothetical protein
MPSIRRAIGAVHAVPLAGDLHGFCIALQDADFAFIDHRSKSLHLPAGLLAMPILFRIAIHKSAWTKGRWPRVGMVKLPPGLQSAVPMFMRDALRPDQYSLYVGGEIRAATRAECMGLERMAVWDPEHAESRLQDHLAGRPNAWVRQLAIGEA